MNTPQQGPYEKQQQPTDTKQRNRTPADTLTHVGHTQKLHVQQVSKEALDAACVLSSILSTFTIQSAAGTSSSYTPS